MAHRIDGTPTRPGFNGVGTINLNDYSSVNPREQKSATFLHYTFLDLDTISENDLDVSNMGVRDEQNTEDRIQSLQDQFSCFGWDSSYPPPCYGTDNKIRDGRGRILSAKRNGEKYIPVAVYNYEDTSNKNYITNSIITNNHPPASRATSRDIITAGVELCNLGELNPDNASIINWLYDEIGITNFFTNTNGMITKIADQIEKVYNNGNNEGLVRVQSRKGWEDWCKTNGYDLGKKCILVSVDNDTYTLRTFETILEACNKGFDPIDIILFTNAYCPKKARKGVQDFEKTLENLYQMAHTMCYAVSRGSERPWCVLGAVPQIKEKHQLESNKLVKVSEY